MVLELAEIVKEYLECIGGLQCKICDHWSNKDGFVGPVCDKCNNEIEEVLAEAEDW